MKVLFLLLFLSGTAFATTTTVTTSTSTTTTTCPPPPACVDAAPITLTGLPDGIALEIPQACACNWGEVWDRNIRKLNLQGCYDTRCKLSLGATMLIGGSPAPGKVLVVDTVTGDKATFVYGDCP